MATKYTLTALNRIKGDLVDHGQFRSLIKYAIQSSDVHISEEGYTIIKKVRDFHPLSITTTFKGTPVNSSSSRLADSESRHVVERELFFEIKDCTFAMLTVSWTSSSTLRAGAKNRK